VPIQVFALPTTGAPIPDRFTMDVGQNLSFTAQITAPGSGGDRYSWTASGGLTCSPSSTLFLRCLATSPGSGALVQLNVTDSNGGNTSVTSPALAVAPDPNVSAPVIAPDPVRVGHSVTMTVLVTGGTGAFRPTWVGLPPGCTGAALAVTCQPSQTGEFRISATVNDSAGFVASSAAAYLNVTAPPVSTNILGVDPLVFYGVLIAIVVVAFSGALGVRMRRRRPPLGPSPSPPR